MPLPIGHTAIGLATYDLGLKNKCNINPWKSLIIIIVLSNLSDVDVFVGLIFHGNGNSFHRGPTHSLLFALTMGLLAANAWRRWSLIPKMSFLSCFLLILSHVLADAFLTWPVEANWSFGYSGWSDVFNLIFLQPFKDVGIVIICGVVILTNRLRRRHHEYNGLYLNE
jgi:membrane-bound metal-dependent hydrolase YbcI (DUF457 family)